MTFCLITCPTQTLYVYLIISNMIATLYTFAMPSVYFNEPGMAAIVYGKDGPIRHTTVYAENDPVPTLLKDTLKDLVCAEKPPSFLNRTLSFLVCRILPKENMKLLSNININNIPAGYEAPSERCIKLSSWKPNSMFEPMVHSCFGMFVALKNYLYLKQKL